MNCDSLFEILHLDDQPEEVAWIPRKIPVWFWKHFTVDMQDIFDEDESADGRTHILRICAGGEALDTRYRIITNPVDFLGALESGVADRIVMILLDQAIGDNPAAGSDTYMQIRNSHPQLVANMFILTAYPHLVQAQLGWGAKAAKLIVKPTLSDRIVAHFVNGLVSVAQIKQETKTKLLSQLNQ